METCFCCKLVRVVYLLPIKSSKYLMYLTYLKEHFKPFANRTSVEVSNEKDVLIAHLPPSCWGCQVSIVETLCIVCATLNAALSESI